MTDPIPTPTSPTENLIVAAPKPGSKTTEFYFTGGAATGMLALVRQVTDWRVQCACVLGAAIIAGMYSMGRSRVKAAASEVLS